MFWLTTIICVCFSTPIETRPKHGCTTQNWPSYDPQEEQSLHDQFCRRNRPPFASYWFFHKQFSLDLARLRGYTRWTVVLFRAHTHRIMIRHLWRSYKRLVRHRHGFFSNISLHQTARTERLSNSARSNENKSFLRPSAHAILNICWWKKCSRMALAHVISHDDLALSVQARHQCSLTQRPF